MNEWNIDLPALMCRATERAFAAGAMVPIETRTRTVEEAGLQLEVRYASALGLKAFASALRGGAREGAAPSNPFLPYEQALFVADVPAAEVAAGEPSSHLLLLNKFPVIEDHLLLITRDFQPQLAMPTTADFIALSRLLDAQEGLVFYNGGPLGGASQPHRHYQWVPSGPWGLDRVLAQAPSAGSVPELPFRHAFIRHEFVVDADVAGQAAELHRAFDRAATLLDFDLTALELPPCNLLLTREWLMLVPRSREHWESGEVSVSINALGFAGSVFVRSPDHIEPLVEHGVLRALAAVTR